MRLSLVDRHLSSGCPPVIYSSAIATLIDRFQHLLALSISSSLSRRSWSKIADLFDGRLFAFTLHQLGRSSSSKLRFDSNTVDVIKECLPLFNLSLDENLFHETVARLVVLEHVTFPSSSSGEMAAANKRQQITRISNPFVDSYLQPIIAVVYGMPFDFVDPQEIHLARYEGRSFSTLLLSLHPLSLLTGKHHWHVFKEVQARRCFPHSVICKTFLGRR